MYQIFGIILVSIQFVENVTQQITQFVLIVITLQYLITTFMIQLYRHVQEIVFQDFLCQVMYVRPVQEIV